MSKQVSVFIEATYYCGTLSRVTLPEGRVWADIAEWFIKWDTLHFAFKGEDEWMELDLNTDWSAAETVDSKRPISVTILTEDEDGNPNYDEELAST